jgi:hypothetical protein
VSKKPEQREGFTTKDIHTMQSMLLDCWGQFCIEVEVDGAAWESDGCLSTLEDLADMLVDHGLLERHPSRPVFRRKP